MANERTIGRWFVNFVPVTQHCKMRPVDTDQTLCSDELLRNNVEANLRKSVRAPADELGIHYITFSRRLHAIGKVRKLDSWVLHELTPDNKNRNSSSVRNTREDFLHRIVTSDEKWISYDNRKLSGQWLDRDQRPGLS